MSARPDPASPRDLARPLVRALAAAVMVLTLAACGLRAETPPPTRAQPRRRRAGPRPHGRRLPRPSRRPRRRPRCCPTAPSSRSRPCSPTCPRSPTSTPTSSAASTSRVSRRPPTPPPRRPTRGRPPTVADVLAELATATRTALADADAVPDGPLARLVASVATSRGELATRLAHATGAEVPSLVPDATAPVEPTPSPTAGLDGLGTDELGDARARARPGRLRVRGDRRASSPATSAAPPPRPPSRTARAASTGRRRRHRRRRPGPAPGVLHAPRRARRPGGRHDARPHARDVGRRRLRERGRRRPPRAAGRARRRVRAATDDAAAGARPRSRSRASRSAPSSPRADAPAQTATSEHGAGATCSDVAATAVRR